MLDLDEEVDDSLDDELPTTEIFSISSYGADYPAELIAKRIKAEDWYVPPFQRSYVWSQPQASRFIESLLLGLPVPGIFLFREPSSGRHLVIDGQQRCRTLQMYLNEEEFGQGRKFRLTKVAERFENRLFSELEAEDQRRLSDSIIHAIIFRQESPEDETNRSVYEVFERLNTLGSKLSDQEIRVCINHGRASSFLEELNDDYNWRSLVRKKSSRLKDQELILRFITLLKYEIEYSRPMKVFLDRGMRSLSKMSDSELSELKGIFSEACKFIYQTIGTQAFRPEKNFNAAAFDSVMVAIAPNVRKLRERGDFDQRYSGLFADGSFRDSVKKSTADVEQVKDRLRIAREHLI